MSVSYKFLIALGLVLMAAAVAIKLVWVYVPFNAVWGVKPSSLLILANISFVLAILAKK